MTDDLLTVLGRCQSLEAAAAARLARLDRRMCQNMICSVVEEAKRLLDPDAGVDAEPSAVALLNRRLSHAEAFMLRRGTRRQPQLRTMATRLIGSA
jgi:hypothetical protein